MAYELLEHRRLLAMVTVDTASDVVDFGGSQFIGDLPGPDNVVSLREALTATNNTSGTDEIDFDTTLFATPQTIQLTTGELQITDSVTIIGPGADFLTVDAQGMSRVVNSDDKNDGNLLDVELSGLSITGGLSTVPGIPPVVDHGGGVRSMENLVVRDSRIFSNVSLSDGQNSGGGGGIFARHGLLTVTDSVISENYTFTVGSDGGTAPGGGIFTYSDLNMTNTTISGNHTQHWGGAGAACFSAAS